MIKQKGYTLIELLICCAVVFIAGLVVLGVIAPFFGSETVTAKITDKERIYTQEQSYYLIFTDKEVFKNSDNWLILKFNSSDLQGIAKIGSTCQMDVYGFRIPALSMYRNIKSLKCWEE